MKVHIGTTLAVIACFCTATTFAPRPPATSHTASYNATQLINLLEENNVTLTDTQIRTLNNITNKKDALAFLKKQKIKLPQQKNKNNASTNNGKGKAKFVPSKFIAQLESHNITLTDKQELALKNITTQQQLNKFLKAEHIPWPPKSIPRATTTKPKPK